MLKQLRSKFITAIANARNVNFLNTGLIGLIDLQFCDIALGVLEQAGLMHLAAMKRHTYFFISLLSGAARDNLLPPCPSFHDIVCRTAIHEIRQLTRLAR